MSASGPEAPRCPVGARRLLLLRYIKYDRVVVMVDNVLPHLIAGYTYVFGIGNQHYYYLTYGSKL